MIPWGPIFDCAADFDPSMDLEDFARKVPGRWVVYLLADGQDRPVQLLCVKNLRASLKRRLGGEEIVGGIAPDGAAIPPSSGTPGEGWGGGSTPPVPRIPSRKIDYREVVRRVYWRRVDSDLEADWVYLEAARAVFPESYRGMVGYRPAWFVHVDPEAEFPRYVKTAELGKKPGWYIGPVEDKHAAGKLIELVEDAFDLCRYYNILTQAPNGRACAYKEMGKCPAPCDGSISMGQYRRMIEWSAGVVVSPADFVREQEARMRAAAGELRFESAAKVKAFVDQVSQLGKGPFRHARRLEDFRYLSVQRGPWAATAKLFVITPGVIENAIDLIGPPQRIGELMGTILATAHRASGPVDSDGAERLAVVSHHLFAPKAQGTFVQLDAIDENAILKAYKAVQKQKVEVSEGEGVVKELTAM